jgi:hypothetical protein
VGVRQINNITYTQASTPGPSPFINTQTQPGTHARIHLRIVFIINQIPIK